MPQSPFAKQSFEPRFVVEHSNKEALVHGIALWLLSAPLEFAPPTTGVRRVTVTATELYCHYPSRRDDKLDGGQALAKALSEEELCDYIWSWLQSATYPEQPWFDGGESRGFSMFWNHYCCEEADRAPRGALIILPKWFEVHK